MADNRFTLERLKDLLWILFIAGMVVGLGRFVFGLGASTNMLDLLPWGLWKVFNMVAGAALATSGFVVAAIIYIFQLERYRPVARFSILIGFLGYGASLVALLFDIGLPHRGWHPFVMWNPHSFLFEVFWCVSIYWSITAFELLPVITERFPLKRLTHFLHQIMLPVVILGITLSTMHHSSLGSLFMASPTRLHPLWYSLWIPPEFFVSAMGAGLSTIVLLSLAFSWLYRRQPDLKILTSLAKGAGALLFLYLVIKVADFTVNGKWNFVFGPDLTWESGLFWVEIVLQAIIPIIIFTVPSLRNRMIGLTLGGMSAFIGLVMHRLNTGIIGYFRSADTVYIPNLSEFVLGFGLLAGAGLVFFMLVERFHVFEEPGHHDRIQLWTKSEALTVFAGTRARRVLITAIIVIPVTWIVFRDQATGPFRPIAQPVVHTPVSASKLQPTLILDANENGIAVSFPHQLHQAAFIDTYKLSEAAACRECHHLSLPGERNSDCRACHQDMLLDTALFNEKNHRDRVESKAAMKALLSTGMKDRQTTLQTCLACHRDNMPGLADQNLRGFSHQAPGYQHAMHGSCQTCHRQLEKDPADPLDDGNCQFCHALPARTDTAMTRGQPENSKRDVIRISQRYDRE
jgi:Ni/Fe-hydrogenase subunit HybB-like protein